VLLDLALVFMLADALDGKAAIFLGHGDSPLDFVGAKENGPKLFSLRPSQSPKGSDLESLVIQLLR
jgi:hypothetical protein